MGRRAGEQRSLWPGKRWKRDPMVVATEEIALARRACLRSRALGIYWRRARIVATRSVVILWIDPASPEYEPYQAATAPAPADYPADGDAAAWLRYEAACWRALRRRVERLHLRPLTSSSSPPPPPQSS